MTAQTGSVREVTPPPRYLSSLTHFRHHFARSSTSLAQAVTNPENRAVDSDLDASDDDEQK